MVNMPKTAPLAPSETMFAAARPAPPLRMLPRPPPWPGAPWKSRLAAIATAPVNRYARTTPKAPSVSSTCLPKR